MLIERRVTFLAKTKRQDNGCLEWQGPCDRAGYGVFWWRGKKMRAHRAAWEIFVGKLEPGKFICHKCDNPPCVDHLHLFQGTAAENNADARKKGRSFVPRGERHGQAKLTVAQVRQIRLQNALGMRAPALSRRYGVSRQAIWKILKGKKWKGV